MKTKITALEVEESVARYFGTRTNMMVPNVSWGLPSVKGEIDMIIVRQSGWAIEVEIKISVSDVKADLKKRHSHDSACIQQTYFAVPKCILDAALPHIPERFGVLVYDHDDRLKTSYLLRACKRNPKGRKMTPQEVMQLGRLASMRIWTLKSHAVRDLNAKRHAWLRRQAERVEAHKVDPYLYDARMAGVPEKTMVVGKEA